MIELQTRRQAQLKAMSPTALRSLIRMLSEADHLPDLENHFRKHGWQLGVRTQQEYEDEFLKHIRRHDLRTFTCIRARGEVRMWYQVGMDTGDVSQYNESRHRYWSFYRPEDLRGFLEAGRGWWLEVQRGAGGLEIVRL